MTFAVYVLLSVLAGIGLRTLLDWILRWLLDRAIRRALVGKSGPRGPAVCELPRCAYVTPEGIRCGRPAAHEGAHLAELRDWTSPNGAAS